MTPGIVNTNSSIMIQKGVCIADCDRKSSQTIIMFHLNKHGTKLYWEGRVGFFVKFI